MYSADMNDVSSMITALGGPAEVGRAIGAKPDTVRKMGERKSVRAKYWPALIKMARVKKVPGVTLANLSRAHEGEAA